MTSKLPPLTAAVADTDVPEVCRLLGTDPRSVEEVSWEQLTPLHWACTGRGSAQICELLLNAGANPNKQNSWGSTPLHYACYGNHVECVRVLAGRGARVDIVDCHGRTPKDDAERRHHTAVLELLMGGHPEDLIGFDSSLEVTVNSSLEVTEEGGVPIPPPAAAVGTTWQREKWQEATRKVQQMHAGVKAWQQTVQETKSRPLQPPQLTEARTPDEISEEQAEAQAEAAKERGNEAMKANKFNQAVSHYTEALRVAPTKAVYYSNRSAAYAKTNAFGEALQDAQKCIELQPGWSKGYARKGAALQGLSRSEEAIVSYSNAIDREKNPAAQAELQKKMDECNAALKEGN